MRKLKLQMQVSLDGFVAGANGEMDWLVWDWDEELKNYVTELTEPVDCILLGHNLAKGFIPHWAANPTIEGAEKINNTPKIVFSKTLEKSEWENTKLVNTDLTEAIFELKNQVGKDIIAYGGGNFVSNLIKNNLIDEYHLFINPAALGSGMSIFKGLTEKLNLKLAHTKRFDCGIVVLCYKPA